MNFDASSVWIIASVAGLAMGIIWVATGLAYSIWRDTDLFDIGFFNLGLVFTFAGSAQLAINRARLKKGDKNLIRIPVPGAFSNRYI